MDFTFENKYKYYEWCYKQYQASINIKMWFAFQEGVDE